MWAQILNAAMGIWLMASPAILGSSGIAADNNHIVGPVITTFAITSFWQATRVVRLWNTPLGIWLIAAPWILQFEQQDMIISTMASGAVITGLSLIKGKVDQDFGGGWKSAFKSGQPHHKAAKKKYGKL